MLKCLVVLIFKKHWSFENSLFLIYHIVKNKEMA